MRVMALAVMMATLIAPALRAVQSQATFKSTTRLVIQLVTVRDERGRPVPNLTAKDFVLTEDGKPQEIAFVEYQAIEEAASAEAPPPEPRVAPGVPSVTGPVIVPPRDARYRGRRLLVFYFDFYQMTFFDKLRTFEHASKYISSGMTPADLVAVMVFDGAGLRLVQDFSADRPALLERMRELEANAVAENSDSAVVTVLPTAFGEAEGAFTIFATDRQLSALQTAVTGFATVPELKTLVYFGGGLRMSGADNISQMRATVNAAVRANVTLNPIDARGLVAQAPMGDASRASAGGVGMFSGSMAQNMSMQFQRSQDALYAIAKDTGGRAMLDNNDLSLGITQAAGAVTGYYIIGYYSTQRAADGKYRRIEVALTGGQKWALQYRRGYYADRPYHSFTRADMERHLAEALKLDDPITEIPIAAEVNYFRISDAEYFVPVSVRMPGSELITSRGSKIEIDVIGEIKDEFGVTVRNMRDKIEVTLPPDRAQRVPGNPIQYETGFTVLPGNYVIKLLARNIATGRIGTYQTAFTVPHLAGERTALPLSSVVFSSQRRAPSDALYRVKTKVPADHVNPLIHEGVALVPDVTRTFSAAHPVYIFLQAYPGAGGGQGIAAFAGFYRDGVRVHEIRSDEPAPQLKSGAVRLQFTLPASSLPPGAYECLVSVINPATDRAGFTSIPITIR